MDRTQMTGRRRLAVLSAVALGVGTAALGAGPATALASGGPATLTGTLHDGATYLIQVPAGWNGTLVLYSHGYVAPGSPNPATDVGDPLTGQWLLSNGYALAGSSYATTGWALQQAIPDQLATLNTFDRRVGTPARTIAWGHSLGGMITAALLQVAPDRFTAALPMCGVVAGGVGTWNQGLDSAVAVQQLLGPTSGLQVVNITSPTTNLGIAETLLATAQATPQGRARIALSSALANVPGWFNPASPEPAPTDYVSQEANQFLWQTQVDGPFAFALRAELEARAGGNPSWTSGVNFTTQLALSSDNAEVQALYSAAGLSLSADLATIQASTPIAASPSAVQYLTKYIVFNGDLDRPVLTLHTTGDGLVVNQDEQAYRNVAQDAGDGAMLREGYVHRAGHCTFTPAETIAAFRTLIHRVNTGTWGDSTNAGELEAAATALGPTYNIAPAAFITFQPTRFLRPFDLGNN
jgi:pimeloyl-ACP methyl ester carboxylesterase